MRPRALPTLALIACGGSRARPEPTSNPVSADAVEVATPSVQASVPPALVVLVVVDQLGTIHLERNGDRLEGGFARLLAADAWQGIGVYAHAKTETCPGHVTLATGAAPAVHGIPANRFMVDGERTYCGDLALLEAESVGDVFTEAGGLAVSLSLKDRASIFLAGSNPTLAAWINKQGQMVHRKDGAVVPVEPALVSTEGIRTWLATPWTALDPTVLEGLPVESAYEVDHDMGRGFPKRPALEVLPDQIDRALKFTPAGGTYLTTAALESVSRHGLGTDAKPDLLTISYSHFDGIGHAHTPASQESVDALFRLDAELATLMAGLDETVGEGRWTLVVTGDHGSPPVAPSYVDLGVVPDSISAALRAAGLPSEVWGDGHGLWLDPAHTPAERERALAVARSVLEGVDGVETVVTPAALADDTPFRDAYVAGYYPGRSADIDLLLEENHVALYAPVGERGTDHGCPRPYDTEVPMLAMGAGVRAGTGRVDTRVVAPSLAAAAGLRLPADATEGVGPWVIRP